MAPESKTSDDLTVYDHTYMDLKPSIYYPLYVTLGMLLVISAFLISNAYAQATSNATIIRGLTDTRDYSEFIVHVSNQSVILDASNHRTSFLWDAMDKAKNNGYRVDQILTYNAGSLANPDIHWTVFMSKK